MERPLVHGSVTPLVTPFDRDGESIDDAALKRLIDFQIENGSHGVSCTGTTGEPTSLTYEERQRVIRTVVEHVAGRVPVLAGTGSNNTRETIALSKYAQEVGASALLVVAPFQVKPTQKGLAEHFTAVAESVELPVMLYNIPGRAGVNIEPATQKLIRQRCPTSSASRKPTATSPRCRPTSQPAAPTGRYSPVSRPCAIPCSPSGRRACERDRKRAAEKSRRSIRSGHGR